MILPENLTNKSEDITWHEVQRCFAYPTKRSPERLLKAETGLPINIVNVVYDFSFELGLMEYIEIQINTDNEINDERGEIFFFTENAESLSELFGLEVCLPSEIVAVVQDYIKKSYSDENSLLYKTMQKRKDEWEKEMISNSSG